MKRPILLGLAIICSLYCLPPAAIGEPTLDEKVKTALESASVIPSGYRMAVVVAGKEAAISTYRAGDANLADCKIDAALMAKALMVDNNFGLVRVRVGFHEPAGTSSVYQEVVVTVAEVKALASGAVTKDEFVASLDVQRLPEQQTSQPEPSKNLPSSVKDPDDKAYKSQPDKSSDNAATTGPKNDNEPVRAIAKPSTNTRYTSRRTGMSFEVPSGWKFVESDGGTIFKLVSTRTNQDNIALTFDGGGGYSSSADRVAAERKSFDYNGVTLIKYVPRTHFGAGPYPGSLIVLTYPNWNDGSRIYYNMELFFGNYKLNAWCDVTAYNTVGPAFDEIVRTMKFPAPAAKPSPVRSGSARRK